MYKYLVFLLIASALVLAEDATKPKTSDRSDYKRSFSRDCSNSYSFTCLKLDVVSYVDKLNENDDISVLPGLSVVRENGSARANTAEIVSDLAREFPNDPDERLDAFLFKKVQDYLNSHSLKMNLIQTPSQETARKGGGGGGGKGGDGGLGFLLAAGAMMKGTLLAVGMGALAALAGKALMTALISLMLSAIVGLKSGGGGHQTTYEVISKPVYTHSSSHSSGHEDSGHYGHSSYRRSFDSAPLPLGLQPNYQPPQ